MRNTDIIAITRPTTAGAALEEVHRARGRYF
jgi:hypothetical protein